MVKIYVTGDNHFGKKYNRYPEAKNVLLESRFECLKNMVDKAEKEECGLFVVTGDLFDNINNIKVSDVKKVVEILSTFPAVVVLPGNHDYYTGEEKVWKDFEDAASKTEHNIVLLNEFRKYELEIGEERVVLYPAYCQSKHSSENNLGWIKSEDIDQEGVINIGVAHGSIRGIAPDMKEEYFLMDESELKSVPVDVWLIGHTHIPYPVDLKEDEDTVGYKVFNAGTHEQTDFNNNTDGNGFVIIIDKQGIEAKVSARKHISGKIRFYDIEINVSPDGDDALSEALESAIKKMEDSCSIVRVTISGSVKQIEYSKRKRIYDEHLGRFLSYEYDDSELSEEITIERIRTEFAETSFAAQFMEALIDKPTELQMAYQLLQSCKE